MTFPHISNSSDEKIGYGCSNPVLINLRFIFDLILILLLHLNVQLNIEQKTKIPVNLTTNLSFCKNHINHYSTSVNF